MPQKSPLRSWRFLVILVTAVGLAETAAAPAQVCRSRCEPSSAIYHSPFFGYYRTCWRPWPGGQPPCPCYPPPPTAETAQPATTNQPAIEMLPAPRPEEPEAK